MIFGKVFENSHCYDIEYINLKDYEKYSGNSKFKTLDISGIPISPEYSMIFEHKDETTRLRKGLYFFGGKLNVKQDGLKFPLYRLVIFFNQDSPASA